MADPIVPARLMDSREQVCLPEPRICLEEERVCETPPVGWRPDSSKISVTGVARPALTLLPVSKPVPAPAPLEIMGKTTYYRWRHEDFKQRHPDKTPPDYYLGYGEKYARRFSTETYSNLSSKGKQWLSKALLNLQRAIEDKRARDPVAFEKLEQNPKAFKDFAFETHAKAYLDAGLADLSYLDMIIIGSTPDLKDLFSRKGLSQAAKVATNVAVDDLIVDPLEKVVKTAWDMSTTVHVFRTGQLPFYGPSGPSGFW